MTRTGIVLDRSSKVLPMSKRHKMSRGHSQQQFSRHASKTHYKNTPGARTVMRGGIRL